MKFIELFAGIGAFRLGLEKTGHECVWANEWLDKPRSIYERNFGHAPDGRDIRTISAGDIPNADLLVGGFPCATFSVAGKRTGFSLEDTRGTLAFEMFRLARDKRIPYILFENVKGLLNHDSGRTFQVILSVLDEMGYDSQWELLNSKNFGVPQHRERVFLVANLRGKPRPKVFPIGQTGEPLVGKVGNLLEEQETLESENYDTKQGFHITKKPMFWDIYNKRTRAVSPTLITPNHNAVRLSVNNRVRKLTPLECERLQGFPDGWTEFYKDGSKVSDTERYERCGRTITIPVVEAIGRKLHDFYAV